jgi:ketosteroid isomerase-like protein
MGRHSDIARAFFVATAAGDKAAIRSICSADLSASQNGAPPMDVGALAGFAAAVKRVVPDFRYENAVRADTQTGFVEEHDVCGTLPDGTSMRLAVCVVGDVDNGQITALREYLDSAAAAGLIAALRPAR